MYSNILAAFTAIMATSVFAAPQTGTSSSDDNTLTVGDAAQQCGNNQALSCCNTSNGDSDGQGGLVGSLLNGLLGGSCVQVPVSGKTLPLRSGFQSNARKVLGVQVPINQACGNNVAACCQGDQNVSNSIIDTSLSKLTSFRASSMSSAARSPCKVLRWTSRGNEKFGVVLVLPISRNFFGAVNGLLDLGLGEPGTNKA